MKFKYITISLGIFFAFVFAPFALPPTTGAHHCVGDSNSAAGPAHTGANIAECLDAGACLDTKGMACPAQTSASDKASSVLRTLLNILSVAAGVIAVIMIIIGGIKYTMSGGESANLTSAKNTILYAIVGLIVVVLSQIIVKFVLKKATTDTPSKPKTTLRMVSVYQRSA